ncbi:hypothetical protein HBHAL_2580 [Halobacillus halophilus DSM 2266]|uniref:Uncharacterized protein n=1 Tax=Halobacillus halophilus (strain ATCC 35676 / DSM 2266 / JCM 20832 / KCTC 3685 / LMG 17431 / NBRC 102448 / NCIMB 2269) TaxID=866895 RepID=I0JLA6_HALH3|nr:hypothetical protein HBHAL_2580 [Halobacillus halophilus DSM 2266]
MDEALDHAVFYLILGCNNPQLPVIKAFNPD